MKKSYIKLLIINVLIILLFSLNIFVIKTTNLYLLSLLLISFIVAIIFLLGFEKNRQRMKKDAILNVLIFGLGIQLIMYLSGLIFGFVRNGYSMRLPIILKNILPTICIIIAQEILRYCINTKSKESKKLLILSAITFIIVDVSLQSSFYDLNKNKDVLELILVLLLPSITKNIYLTYNSCTFGYESNILYRVIMELPIYIIPIIPAIGDYMNAIISFVAPIILLIVTTKTLVMTNNNKDNEDKFKLEKIIMPITVLFMTTIIILVSGLFPLYILCIGSNSMKDAIHVGDAVLVKKITKEKMDSLKIGQVIVYRHDDKVIVHRIFEIRNENGQLQIITKGDNNKEADAWVVYEKDIIGTTNIVIPYVGYPTIWLNSILND